MLYLGASPTEILWKGTKAPVFNRKQLCALLIPLMLEQILASLMGMADTMMVSNVGSHAIAAVSLVDSLNIVMINLFSAMATGGSIICSQYIGRDDLRQANETARQLLLSITAISIVIGAVCLTLRRPLLSLIFGRVEDTVMENAEIYMLVTALSFPFLAMYNAGAALFRSMGNSQITLKVSVVENIINIGGNALGVYVLGLGVAGVAIPSLISRAVAGFILYHLLKNPSNEVHLLKERFHIDWPVIHKIFYIGIPSGIENGIFQLGRVIVVSIIAGFGTVQIAANGVANSLDSMGCIVGQAMNLAMITVIGRCVGAGDSGQVRYYTKKLLKITYLCTFMVNSVILLCLSWILKCYGLSPETTQLSYILVMIHNGMAMFLWPASFVLPNMLRACNDVRFTMVLSIFSMFVFRIGFSYIIGVNMGYGAIGVWIAMVLDWIFRVICFVSRYLSGHWLKTAGLQDNR